MWTDSAIVQSGLGMHTSHKLEDKIFLHRCSVSKMLYTTEQTHFISALINITATHLNIIKPVCFTSYAIRCIYY